MESLRDTLWDVVICGTGLQQSLLALALSRSGKQILHIDPNDYYGGHDGALSLQEADGWVATHSHAPSSSETCPNFFSSASISTRQSNSGLSFPRAYSLALSPQLIHTRSALLSQLVSSRAYRQIEFLAVGSFFILNPSSSHSPRDTPQQPSLTRIPSTREDVFSTSSIPARSKRSLMKFLKFVVDYDNEDQIRIWQPHADEPLTAFLQREFSLNTELQTYIIVLTLSLDGTINTRDGLAAIQRHLSSMGMFGPGFAAVYPKWGGLSEITQVACRAGAVGGGVYMLGTDVKDVKEPSEGSSEEVFLDLTNGDSVKTRMLVRGAEHKERADNSQRVSRLVAVIGSPMPMLFETSVEGAPIPAVAVVACPAGSMQNHDGEVSQYPVYLLAHSADSGECPVGQSVLYLTTLSTAHAKSILESSLASLLAAMRSEGEEPPKCIYQLYYEQVRGSGTATASSEGLVFTFPSPSPTIAFEDSTLDSVRQAWAAVMGPEAEGDAVEYMVFPDREGAGDDDDIYD